MLDKTQIHFDDIYTPVSFRFDSGDGIGRSIRSTEKYWDRHYGTNEKSRYTGLSCNGSGILRAAAEGAAVVGAGGVVGGSIVGGLLGAGSGAALGIVTGVVTGAVSHIVGCWG